MTLEILKYLIEQLGTIEPKMGQGRKQNPRLIPQSTLLSAMQTPQFHDAIFIKDLREKVLST